MRTRSLTPEILDTTEIGATTLAAVLQDLAEGHPPGPAWETLDAVRFFEELLAELTETYYAHPLAQEEIGYVGMADLPAWTKIGLNEKDDRELPMGE